MIEYDFQCIYCNAENTIKIIEYGETEVQCECCQEKQNVVYSEDCTDDFSDCWDSYWVEEIE